MSYSISVCMIVKNEAQLMGNCLRGVGEFADEILVVDTGSTDKTVEIARKFGARIIRHRWDGSYGRARNVYVRSARGDWILVLDGDEAIARADSAKIKRLVRRRGVIGYHLTVRNYTDDYDLMWNWYPNDRTYPEEEKLSSCPGWMRTQPLRLFRNFEDIAYVEGTLAHTSPLGSLKRHAGRIETRGDVAIHHFQYLKGGGRFIAGKQRLRLEGEMAYIGRFPREPYPYLNVAKTLFGVKRDDEAVKYISRAVKLDPAFHDAYQLWGMIELENGRLASAEKRLRQAIGIDPKSADAWALLGVALVEDGRLGEGKRALQKALRLRPTHLLAHNSLGVLYEDQGMRAEAREAYQTALKLHPRFKPARANLARLLRADGKLRRRPAGLKG
jgi:glycosyltransferase involved in cell wall biosynthesis